MDKTKGKSIPGKTKSKTSKRCYDKAVDRTQTKDTIYNDVDKLVSKAREESDDKTKLRRAAEQGDNDTINLLHDKGVDVDTRDGHEPTPLMIASRHGKSSTVRVRTFI